MTLAKRNFGPLKEAGLSLLVKRQYMYRPIPTREQWQAAVDKLAALDDMPTGLLPLIDSYFYTLLVRVEDLERENKQLSRMAGVDADFRYEDAP